MNRAILLTGFFTDKEMQILMSVIRGVEQRHQDVNYQVIMLDPEHHNTNTVEENIAAMREMFPPSEDGEPARYFYTKSTEGKGPWKEVTDGTVGDASSL